MRKTLHSCIHLLALCGIIVASIALPSSPLRAEENALLDTPVSVVSDNSLEEWSLGNGLVYWANSCYADEFNSHADLKRKPVSGGTERTIQTIDDGKCITFLHQLSSNDGLYYYNDSKQQIERMPLSEPFTPVVIKAVTTDSAPSNTLVESNGYLYWPAFRSVLRTLKDGSGPIETVVNISGSASDVLVVGNTVYFTENNAFSFTGGMKSVTIACDTLPCTGTPVRHAAIGTNERGGGLLYQPPTGGIILNRAYRVYWVQATTSTPYQYNILYCSFSELQGCQDIVIDPTTAATAAATDTATAPVSAASPDFQSQLFYQAPQNWLIGEPVFANGSLYWTERDISTANNTTGDVKRRATNAAPPITQAETIATAQEKIDSQLFVANDNLYFASRYKGIYSISLNATAITRDFTADAFEVTQAIQNLANNAPLVAQKPTYVRAYGKQISGPNAPNVEARLIGSKNGSPLPGSPLQPINGLRALTTGGSYDRARLNDGWLFQLPESWIASGQISLNLVVDPRQAHSDPNRANNTISKTITFQNQPPVCVWTVPVRTHTPKPSTTDPNFWSMVDQFNRRWPVPATWIFRDTNPVEELQICTWYGVPYPCYGPYELEDGWGITNGPPDRDKVIASLWTRAQLTFNPDACDNIGAPVHFMGMVHPDANNGGASGYASTVSNQSWVQLPDHSPNPMPQVWNSMREGSVMAQELAHNYGRKHVNCGSPDNIDNSYPYPGCQIANVGADSYYGFDIASRQPIRPNQTADFMSYANRTWVSDYTWRSLINKFSAVNVAAAPNTTAAGDSVFVSGLVDEENSRGEISTLLVLPTTSVPAATQQSSELQAADANHGSDPHATYKLRLLDASGTILSEQTLTLTPMDDHSGDGASALFSALFPKPTGIVAKVQLLADATVIDTIQPGTAQPTVTVSEPTAGRVIEDAMTIKWSANDADAADQLLFTLQYSHDNGTKWHTLVTNFPSTPTGQYSLTYNDLGSLQGSATNAARIRVLASDGFNTTIATSPAFTVKNRKPEPFIVTPGSNESYPAGETIILRGGASDAEDGGLAGASLVWTVDGVNVGSGAEVAVAGLSTGSHTAIISATDSISNSAATSLQFNVSPLSIPLATSAPTLDGICNDSSYADATQIQTKSYASAAQATARIIRSDDFLWACFSGIEKGAISPGAFVGLRIDVDKSGGSQAQASDYGFFAGEDGSVSTSAGDGVGGFAASGPGGLQAQVSSDASTWSAELRIDKATLGGWDHLVRLNAGHYWNAFQGDDYLWPYASIWNSPATWAEAALGIQPTLTAIDPFTATVGSPSLTLNIEGSGFVSGTTVLWGGTALNANLVDSEHMTATVAAAQLSTAGVVKVSIQSPAPGNFESNKLDFDVIALPPVISSLSPNSVPAESPGLTLTVNGSNFTADSQVLWNGTPVTTTFVSATKVTAQISAALLEVGQSNGVAIRNQSPEERISDAAVFEVHANSQKKIFLPLVSR